MLNRQLLVRLTFHLILAVFLANAANKFFIPDFETEERDHFYEEIFAYDGYAPDQYRILPLLGLKVLTEQLSFNHAVLVFNFLLAFLSFEILFLLWTSLEFRKRLLFNLIFAVSYIYLQYTGWRPDTMGLFFICLLNVWVGMKMEDGWGKMLLLMLTISTLAFSRAEIALGYALFLGIYGTKSWPTRILLPVLAIAAQLVLQFFIFPDAKYYTKTVMVYDNLSFYYIVKNPTSWLILALILGFGKRIWEFIRQTYPQFKFLYFGLAGYFLLIFVIGRVNEYRLYLPFLPLFIWAWEQRRTNDGEKTGSI